MSLTIAWLAQGKIRLKCGDEPPRTIESQFGQGIRDRTLKAQQRHGWKTAGEGEKFLAGAMLWGRSNPDPAAVRVFITSLCRGAERGQLLYALETDDMCSVLQLDQLGAEERRLWNKNDKRLDHLDVSERGDVACSIRHQIGTANIAVRPAGETGFGEATEGDSVDTAPRWIPGEARRLVFQSAGVGRNRHGHFAGLGPFAIQRLDVDSGEMTTLLEDSRHDLLGPQMTADGTLYFIRRPYVTGREVNPLRLLKDILLFPIRLLVAVFHFLQFFSMRYSGKKLTSADGAQSREADLKQMMIWGNMVSAQRATKDGEEAPDLAPKWELIRREPNGSEQVLAKGVVSYDLAADGTVYYSNGSAIFALPPGGKKQRLVAEAMVERVVIVGTV
jgi:hypothetical protein